MQNFGARNIPLPCLISGVGDSWPVVTITLGAKDLLRGTDRVIFMDINLGFEPL